ncbi:MAG TPA: DUF1573 domain-containing protein [Kiritimatiellia bacterium]|nr:DUF1573 domain-containing protein [Kiritimatiellia bacterium]
MKHGFAAGLVLSALAFTPLRADEPTPQGPRISVDNMIFDFGVADNSQIIEHTYVIRNIGDTTLELREIRPTCGCTVADVSSRSIPPGGESRITSKLSLPGRTGRQSKPIIVRSNDPEQPEIRLVMSGTFTSAVQVTPDRFFFGQVEPNHTLSFEISVNAQSERDVNIISVQPADGFSADIEVHEPGRRSSVKVSATTPPEPGVFNGWVRIMTDHPARSMIEVPISGNVVGALIVAPPEITLSARHQGPVTRYIVLRAGTGGMFQIESVEPPLDTIQANVFPFGGNGFRIQLDQIEAIPEINGANVTIRTSLASHPVVTVPFRLID